MFDPKESAFLKRLRRDFSKMVAIKKLSYCQALFCCKQQYKRMMVKSQSDITKELDLRKFILR